MCKFKKIFMLGVALIMCLGIFSGCGDNIEPLSTEQEAQIKQDYLQEFGTEFYHDRYYGLYNGAAVFFVSGDAAVVKTVMISGLKFSYGYSWTILVWKDSIFYNLEDIETIFEAGVLTQADLRKIAAIHAKAN